MGKLEKETESVSVKDHLSKTVCDFFQKPEHSHHAHHHVKDARLGLKVGSKLSHNGNVTVAEESTTYQSYNGQKPVTELNAEDLKCHHDSGHRKGSNPNSHWNADERDVVDMESHDESAPSKEVLNLHDPQHDHHGSKDRANSHHPATEKSHAFGDSEKDVIQQSHHSLTETSLSDKSSSSQSQSLPPSSAPGILPSFTLFSATLVIHSMFVNNYLN